jgi:hypothetical protein
VCSAEHSGRMLRGSKRVAFLCCDIQERFLPLIFEMPSVIRSAVTLVSGPQGLAMRVRQPRLFAVRYGPHFGSSGCVHGAVPQSV